MPLLVAILETKIFSCDFSWPLVNKTFYLSQKTKVSEIHPLASLWLPGTKITDFLELGLLSHMPDIDSLSVSLHKYLGAVNTQY